MSAKHLVQMQRAIDAARTRLTPKYPAIILMNPEDYRWTFGSYVAYLGIEIGPDPRVEEGLAVACDRDLNWLAVFSWNKSEDAIPGEGAGELVHKSWRTFGLVKDP